MTDGQFSEFWREHRPRLVGWAKGWNAPNPELAADDALSALDRVREDPSKVVYSPLGWLYRVVKRNVCGQHRARDRDDGIVERIKKDPTVPKVVPPVEQEALEEELRREVMKAIERLPDKQRDIAKLRLLYGYTNGEVAKALEISAGEAKTRFHSACKKLQKFLEGWNDH